QGGGGQAVIREWSVDLARGGGAMAVRSSGRRRGQLSRASASGSAGWVLSVVATAGGAAAGAWRAVRLGRELAGRALVLNKGPLVAQRLAPGARTSFSRDTLPPDARLAPAHVLRLVGPHGAEASGGAALARAAGLGQEGGAGAAPERHHRRVRHTSFPQQWRTAVRGAVGSGDWQLALRDSYVRPPERFPDGARNPLSALGECADEDCALTRVSGGQERVRPEFLEYCVDQIVRFANVTGHDGLTYCTLGCGCLYFDWELLDRLRREGVRVSQVWLLERCYRKRYRKIGWHLPVMRARSQFSRWFANAGIEIYAFSFARQLKQWAKAFRTNGQAHVVVQCDAVETAHLLDSDQEFVRAVMRDGAINLQVYSQCLHRRVGGTSRRRTAPVRRLRRLEAGREAALHLLEERRYKDGWAVGRQHLRRRR
ncbi:unnamed protein product, partial [Prorocentrum cordatum]